VYITLDYGPNISCALHRGIEIRNLEPEQSAVAEGDVTRRERAVVILYVDVVQLQDELPATDELLILLAAVGALGPEDLGVELARCPDVANDDEWLRPDLPTLYPGNTLHAGC